MTGPTPWVPSRKAPLVPPPPSSRGVTICAPAARRTKEFLVPTLHSRRPRAVAVLTALSVTLLGALAGATTPAGARVEASPAPALRPARRLAAAKQKTIDLTVLPPISQPGKKTGKAKQGEDRRHRDVHPGQEEPPCHALPEGGRRLQVGRQHQADARPATPTSPCRPRRAPSTRRPRPPTRACPPITTKTVKNPWKGADFVDEFGGSTLRPDWTHRAPFYNPDGLRICSKGDPSAAAVTGGAAAAQRAADPARTAEACTAKRADGSTIGNFKYRLNGHISTIGDHDFRYGVAAARMKFQKEKGQHASFWLQPTVDKPEATTAKEGGAEVDIIEWFGARRQAERPDQLHLPPLDRRARSRSAASSSSRTASWPRRRTTGSSRYHVFSVEWTPEGLHLPHRRPGQRADHRRHLRGAAVPDPEPALLRLRAGEPRQREQAAAALVRRLDPDLGALTSSTDRLAQIASAPALGSPEGGGELRSVEGRRSLVGGEARD